jgi:hypothetical protein
MGDFKLISNSSSCLDAEITIDNDIYNYLKYKVNETVHAFISRSIIIDANLAKYRIIGSYYIDEIKNNKVIKSNYGQQELNKNIKKYRSALSRFNAYLSFL